jgi:hypothetical protein
MLKHPTIQRLGLFAGLLLIIGFIFPVIIPFGRSYISFPNIEMMFQRMVPFTLRLYMFFPVIGAVLCFVALSQGKSMTRAILYLIAGFFPWLLELEMGSEMGDSTGGMGTTMFGGGILNMGTFISTMFNFGLLGLIVGAISGDINRGNRIAPMVALVGGGLVALSLVFPMGWGEFGGPSILLILPFQLFSEMPLVSLGLLVFYGLLIPACVFGIIWGIRHQSGVNHSKRIKSFVGGAFLWIAIFIFLAMVVNIVEHLDGITAMLMVITVYVKMIGMIVGPFLAKCCGLTEIIANIGHNPDAGDGMVKMNPNPSQNPFDTGHSNPFDISNQTAFGDEPTNTSSRGGQDHIV